MQVERSTLFDFLRVGPYVWADPVTLLSAVSEAGDAHNADSRASTVIQYLIPYVRFIGSVLGIRDQR